MSTNCLELQWTPEVALRVAFFRRQDRYGHRVSLVQNEREFCLLTSLEGENEERWPPSPPFQQLTLETRPDGAQVALLVGMAGSSHWSMSVEPLPDRSGFAFDVACLWKAPPEFLGSTYVTEVEKNLSPSVIDRVNRLSLSIGECELSANVRVESANGTHIVRAIPNRSASSVTTTRWRYAWTVQRAVCTAPPERSRMV